MGLRKTIVLILGLLCYWILCISLFRTNFGSTTRYFNDDSDRLDYAIDGRWYLTQQVPYRDTISEYPQIPTYLFALPFVFAHFEWGEFFNSWLYNAIFSLLMLGFLLGTIIILYRMLPNHKNRAFLLLLPAPLYFSYNRFDIIPSFLVLIALLLVQKKNNILSAIVLGIATMTKWYPALLFPAFLVYVYKTQHQIGWKMVVAYVITCLLIVIPTLITGGVNALMVPYLIHAQRGFEYVSIPALTETLFNHFINKHFFSKPLLLMFLILSILPAILSIVKNINTFDKLIRWSIVIVAFFIVFSRIWSPQWLLWIFPLVILSSRNYADVVWTIVYGIVNYLAFMILLNLKGVGFGIYILLAIFGYALLFRFSLTAIRRENVQISNLPTSANQV